MKYTSKKLVLIKNSDENNIMYQVNTNEISKVELKKPRKRNNLKWFVKLCLMKIKYYY